MNENLQESFDRVFQDYSSSQLGNRAELLDIVFAYRILLSRMPSNEEIAFYLNCTDTWREFLIKLLQSEEFSKRLDFLPGGLELMTENNGFRFWFNSADREMGAKMATGQYEPKVVHFLKNYLQSGMTCLDIGAQTGF